MDKELENNIIGLAKSIARLADRTTSGNLSHNLSHIKRYAGSIEWYINRYKKTKGA